MNLGERKKHININIFAGLSRDWMGAKKLLMCFLGHSLCGEKKAHKQNPPPKIPGQSREKFVVVFFSLCVFFSLPRIGLLFFLRLKFGLVFGLILLSFSGCDLPTCMLLNLLRRWFGRSFGGNPQFLEADDFLGECCKKALALKKLWSLLFPYNARGWHVCRSKLTRREKVQKNAYMSQRRKILSLIQLL